MIKNSLGKTGNDISRPLIDKIYERTLLNGVQLQGRTSGIAIPAGCPGEFIIPANSVFDFAWPNNVETDWPDNNIVLTPGSWTIKALANSEGNATGYHVMYLKKTDGTLIGHCTKHLAAGALSSTFIIEKNVDISVTTTYKISVYTPTINGNFSGLVYLCGIRR
jgi:hypothetical protein